MPGLNTKIAALNVLVEASNTKLDTIITMLGGAPPTPTATLDDLLAALIAINTDTTSMDGRLITTNFSLDDIHTDTMSIDAKLLIARDTLIDILADTTAMDDLLLAIRNILRDPSEPAIEDATQSIAWNVYRLRKAVATANLPSDALNPMHLLLSSLYNITNSLMAINNTHLGTISSAIFTGADNLGLSLTPDTQVYDGYLFSVLNWLGLVSGSIGLPIEANNRDVIQLLAKIADRPESPVGSGLAPAGLCDEPYVSEGMVLVPAIFQAWPALVYAIFPSPAPAPISFGTVFGVGTDYTELAYSNGHWHGWGAYVASSAPNFGLFIGGDIDQSLIRYPTNVWVDIGDFDYNLSFYVGGSDSIRVFLCGEGWGGDDGGPWGSGGGELPPEFVDCVDIASIPAIITHPNSSTTSITVIPMSLVPAATFSDRYEVSSGGFFITDVGASVVKDNWNGVTIELLSGDNNVRVWYQKADLSFVVHGFSTVGDSYTIAEDCITASIETFTGGTSTAFSVRICPPA